MPANNFIEIGCLQTTFGDISVYTFPMKVKHVIAIYYVAVRGRDDEEAAVQRVLNKKRIESIKQFVLLDNMFFNTFILNWTETSISPQYLENGSIKIPICREAAQVIDGQHRLAGLEEAVKVQGSIGEKEILVSLCIGLATKDAAAIFLNINSEQKPVPRSLIYDLYGLVVSDKEVAINRANDIAQELHENQESAYYGLIKYPGKPRGAGVIDLATVVSSLKPHLENDGVFAHYNLTSLNYQKQVIVNFFQAIKYFYDKDDLWNNKKKNPFLKSSGFYGAIEFLSSTLLPKCVDKKSFKVETFEKLLSLDQKDLLLQDQLKNLDGKTARKKIVEFLESAVLGEVPSQDQYEF